MEPSELKNKKDIHQNQYPDIDVWAGIKDLEVTVISPKWTLLVNLEVMVPLGTNKGVHMSRLVLPHQVKVDSVETFITQLKQQVFKKHNGDFPSVKATFKFPWRDQFATISIENLASIKNIYTFKIKGITACPCSVETCGIGHMQKCTAIVTMIGTFEEIQFEWALEQIEKCFSATLNEKLKRHEEAQKILDSQQNARFVEDVCREVYKIPYVTEIKIISDESIHSHKAVAYCLKENL